MPRRAPTQIIEHRLSLSDYERTALKEWLAERQKIERLNAGSRGVASVGAVATSSLALWLLAGYFALDILPDAITSGYTTLKDSVTVWQRKCPSTLAIIDGHITSYEARLQDARDRDAPARFIVAEEKKLQKLRDRRAVLANGCEWVTTHDSPAAPPSLKPEEPSLLEIWFEMWKMQKPVV